jgi:hypothetical protein
MLKRRVGREDLRRTLVKLVLLAALTGFAGVPGFAAAPDWIADPPETDAESTWFTGVGTSSVGDAAAAEETARSDLIDGIMSYLGVTTTTGTTAAAKTSVDAYRTRLRQQLTQESAGQIDGLAVEDRYVEKGETSVTVHLLARCLTADLDRQKGELEGIFLEQQEETAAHGREAETLEQAGRLYEAALAYLAAAAAASTSDADDAAIAFERAMNGARAALERISLLKLNDNLSTAAGSPFAEPFRAKAVGGAKPADPAVPEVALTVCWADRRTGTRQVASAHIRTAEDGEAAFVHPAPGFVGSEIVTMAVDIAPSLSGFGKLTKDQQAMVDGLADLAARKRVVFSFESYSPGRDIESAVAAAAFDAAGTPLAGQDFAGGILKPLNAAGFRVKAVALEPAAVAGLSDEELIDAAAEQAGATTRRIVYGTARVEGTTAGSGVFAATVNGSVKVADVKTGVVLLTVSRTGSAEASTAAAAVSAALAKLGEDVGQEIVTRLR